ncbi:MAG: hypothetical protein ACPHF4_15530 [Rubripirellula sp.]
MFEPVFGPESPYPVDGQLLWSIKQYFNGTLLRLLPAAARIAYDPEDR